MGVQRASEGQAARRIRVPLPPRRPSVAVIAAVAISDIAYRAFMRAPLRRALGIEARHA